MHHSPADQVPGLSAAGGTKALGNNNTSKIEAIASAAVRCAERVQASLLVVFTHTGQSAQLVVSSSLISSSQN